MPDKPAGVNMNNSPGCPGLIGWERIEKHYKRLDQNMADGFNKDIDTLLVFAGLFSAVLTAFLMQSNTLLQVNDSQRTVDLLAQLVALQMGNSSNQSAVQSLPFTPSSSSVLINSLWYISLVLSLASALFGMMAKQWLHEYLQWTTMSTLSADAVLLRQLRYEAFVDWKTPGVLVCIPVLLEVAVALFSVGMVVHLFTLNAIVADVCTVAIVIMLALTILSLILPLSFPRCPYKSPAGWGLVLLMRICASLWDMMMFGTSLISATWSNPNSAYFWFLFRLGRPAGRSPVKDWRTRDFELPLRDGIVGDILQLYPHDSLIPNDVPQLSREATRIYALSHALLWIQETSQDGQLLATVNECYKMRNSPTVHWHADRPIDALILDFVFVCDRLHVSVNDMRAYLHPIYHDVFGMNPLAKFQVTEDIRPLPRHDVFVKIVGTPWMARAVLGNILSVTVLQLLSHLSPGASTDPAWTTPLVVNHLLLCGHIIPLERNLSAQTQDVRRACMDNFKSIFDLLSTTKELCQKLPGIRGILLHFMFEWEESTDFTLIPAQSSRYDAYATLACQTLAGNPQEWTHDDCDVFMRVSSLALQKAMPEDAPRLQELLACMEKCVERLIEQEWDCGSYSMWNPWTAGPNYPLYRLFHPRGRRYTPDMDRIYPHALIDTLRRCDPESPQGRTTVLQALIARSAELLRTAQLESSQS